MPPASNRHFRVEDVGQVTVVTFFDRRPIQTEASREELGQWLCGLVATEGRPQILLNFARVEYLSSHFLATLIHLKKRVHVVKGKLKLCCLGHNREFFPIAGPRFWESYDDQQTALEAF